MSVLAKAARLDAPAVHFHQRLADREAQPQTSEAARDGALGRKRPIPAEVLQNLFEPLRRYLRPGRSFSWSWNRGGEPTGSIGVRVHDAHSLVLQYMIGEEGARRDGSQTIAPAYTACHYGNQRPWFVCPRCQRRAGLLFMRWGRFACRHCQRVAYSSQAEDVMDRTWRQQSKIEARLGKTGDARKV
jgi:hypothetical protein